MPTPRTWLPRVYEILEILRASKAREFDRAAIEKLFELQRRAALILMKQVGVVQRHAHSAVPRQALLAWVERVEANEAQDLVRRQEVSAQLDQGLAEKQAVKKALEEAGRSPAAFSLTREVLEATLDSLPPDIHIVPGRITINFRPDDPIQACQMLYTLGLVLANDFDSFAAIMIGKRSDVA